MVLHSCPTFKTYLHAEIVHRKKQVILFDENQRCYSLKGEVYVHLVPYLKEGVYSLNEIMDRLIDKVAPAEVCYAVLRLEKNGFLEENLQSLPKKIQTLCNLLGVSYENALKRLNNISVSIHTFGSHEVQFLTSVLRELSIQIVDQGQFLIILTENYRDRKLREFCRQLKTPYILLKPTRSEIWLGPIFTPEQTPCLECLCDAISQNSYEESWIEHEGKKEDPITIRMPIPTSMSQLAYAFAAHEIFKWIVNNNADLKEKMISYHFLHPTFVSHQVRKKSTCPNCGNRSSVPPQPMILESQKKRYVEDGGHRVISPEETYKNYQHLISPITGIIDTLIPAFQDPLKSIHTYEAEHLLTMLHRQASAVHEQPRNRSGGKGKTAAQARTSCLCESIERYSGIYQGDEYRFKARYCDIESDAIHPYKILLFSENQYNLREKNNANCSAYHFVPERFNPFEEVDWTLAWSFTHQKFKWVPTAFCYYSYPFFEKQNKFCIADSNGCAAGNTKEEAILQGFFEIVEKDSIALWWYSRFQLPEIDVESFHDCSVNQIKLAYEKMGRKLWVLDVTMDLQIPTFAAISCKNNGEILFGFGSHFDPSIALSRAVTEMNQTLLFCENLSGNRIVTSEEQWIRKWIQNEKLNEHPYLSPNEKVNKKKKGDFVRLDTPDMKEDILICQRIVESKGLEMLVLDQTRVDIGLPVIKVIVPGLRHFWNRYAPGRLYDIPFELGLVPRKLQEEELNPIPYFL